MAGRLQERCSGCGAAVGVEALTCAYCGAASPHALRAKASATEAELAQAEANVKRTEDEVRRGGTTALVAASVGVVTCCLPIGAVLGLIFAQRARRQAKEAGLVAPKNIVAPKGIVVPKDMVVQAVPKDQEALVASVRRLDPVWCYLI